jgi:hypothetical protein
MKGASTDTIAKPGGAATTRWCDGAVGGAWVGESFYRTTGAIRSLGLACRHAGTAQVVARKIAADTFDAVTSTAIAVNIAIRAGCETDKVRHAGITQKRCADQYAAAGAGHGVTHRAIC